MLLTDLLHGNTQVLGWRADASAGLTFGPYPIKDFNPTYDYSGAISTGIFSVEGSIGKDGIGGSFRVGGGIGANIRQSENSNNQPEINGSGSTELISWPIKRTNQMIYLLLGIALSAFTVGTVMFYRFSKVTGRSVQSPFTPMFFFDALFFGLGSRRDMNIAACAFMVFLLSIWGLTCIKLRTNFWGSPESYFGLGIIGIFFLIMHCRYSAKDVVILREKK